MQKHLGAVLFVGLAVFLVAAEDAETNQSLLPKETVARSLASYSEQWPLPSEISLGEEKKEASLVNYTIERELQSDVEKLFKSYRPDYGAFVALEADTGKVISLFSYERNAKQGGNLALRASFPAASIIKIVTATAALDKGKMNPDSTLSFTGGNHTLYRRNVFQKQPTRWDRWVTLSDAFAKSINTVFAKVGLFVVEPKELLEYADRFQFNQKLPFELPAETSKFEVSPDDQWSVAEVASGFNRNVTISPVHGALLAAAVANDGVMMEPCLVSSIVNSAGDVQYQCEPKQIGVTMSPDSARALRQVMNATISHGTARQAFRTLFRKKESAFLDIGGKTGSLVGFSPKGKYDWFVGYARGGSKKIAVAALTINEDNWRVKASFLARTFIEKYFTQAKEVAIGSSLGQ